MVSGVVEQSGDTDSAVLHPDSLQDLLVLAVCELILFILSSLECLQ